LTIIFFFIFILFNFKGQIEPMLFQGAYNKDILRIITFIHICVLSVLLILKNGCKHNNNWSRGSRACHS
jgi:hypothetical protein